jgi:hypothetical protein
MPPKNAALAEKKEYEAAFNERASNYRYRRHSRPDSDGYARWQSPFAAGALRSEQVPESMRNPRKAPLADLGDRKPPPNTLTVAMADLPLQQRLPAGTTAHGISMSRRNAVEGVNGSLKSNFTNVDRGYTRVFGNERVALFLAFTLAGLNAFIARSFRRKLKAEAERPEDPRSRARRRKGTFDRYSAHPTLPQPHKLRRGVRLHDASTTSRH